MHVKYLLEKTEKQKTRNQNIGVLSLSQSHISFSLATIYLYYRCKIPIYLFI